MAVFKIEKPFFDRIAKKLAASHSSAPKKQGADDATGVDDSVVDALDKSHARGQGFQLDSKLRKALEDYAMDAARRHFMSLGYDVEDHSKNLSFTHKSASYFSESRKRRQLTARVLRQAE